MRHWMSEGRIVETVGDVGNCCADYSTDQDVCCVVSVIHRSGDGDSCCDEKGEEDDPGFELE